MPKPLKAFPDHIGGARLCSSSIERGRDLAAAAFSLLLTGRSNLTRVGGTGVKRSAQQ